MFGIGGGEFVIILIVGLIVFGPSKLPELGRMLGRGMKEFRKAQMTFSTTLEELNEPIKKTPQIKESTESENITDSSDSTHKDDSRTTLKKIPQKSANEKEE